jgi:hypothetical protein
MGERSTAMLLVRLLFTPPATAGAALLLPPLAQTMFERTQANPPFSIRLLRKGDKTRLFKIA